MAAVKVVGAGLAGAEAAWQLAQRGVEVTLYEMKPHKKSPAHHADTFAELVCSNSLRGDKIENAVGLLKEELRRLDSLIIACADATRVEAGGCLAVDRQGFSDLVTKKIRNHPNITVVSEEVTEVPEGPVIIATGPLTSDALSKSIGAYFGSDYLHFFDAAAPIVTYESIDMSKAFRAARYGKGGDDYINCPMNKEEYLRFYTELKNAECAEVHDAVENQKVFEGCMPIEVMASRGEDTMRFGPLKPVGLTNPHDNSRPYAVVQLRQDNADSTLFNIVGFQTHLKFGEQKRVFGMIPGLENAEIVRYGVMHRNTYINSPKLLTNTYAMKKYPKVFFAGQITGVEGYIESAASGFMAGINAAKSIKGEDAVVLSNKTALGALSSYVSNPTVTDFQPMNVNFGIFETLGERIKDKKEKAEKYAERSFIELEKALI